MILVLSPSRFDDPKYREIAFRMFPGVTLVRNQMLPLSSPSKLQDEINAARLRQKD